MTALCVWLLWICFYYYESEAFASECLASSTKQFFNNTELLYYPLDVYAPSKVFSEQKSKSSPCLVVDILACTTDCHLCTQNKSFCPLSVENVNQSLQRTTRNSRASLCILKDKLMNKSETVNVFVTGGSVTVGCMTDGCCSAPGCRTAKRGFRLDVCSWSSRFAGWLNASFAAHVNYVNIGDNGMSSSIAVDEFAARMLRFNVKPFTSSDVIFLDHSVNDNSIGTGGSAVENAVEMMIRRIYHHSTPHSLPTIVLLVVDPIDQTQKDPYTYYQAYEKVGRHYDIPVWSYRDAVLSNFSRVNQSQYNGFLNFTLNLRWGGDKHPGWPVHLFMADLYAGIFMHDTNQFCDMNIAENRILYAATIKQSQRSEKMLPTPLSSNASFMCDMKLLSLSYDSVVHNLKPVGEYRFEPEKGGWNLTVDKVGRAGGFIVTEEAPNGAKVIFTLNITTKEFVERKINFHLYLHYLRSYENAGVARVSLCNNTCTSGRTLKSNGVLDSLWEDYKTHRYSLPDLFSPETHRLPYSFCEGFSGLHPTVEVTFNKQGPNKIRGNQKFKLMNIKVCPL